MTTTSYLLRLSEAAELLGLTPGPARRWLEAHKVPMVDYGPGRGLGPRWPRDGVMEAIQSSLVYHPSAEPKRRKKASRPITGRNPITGAQEVQACSTLKEARKLDSLVKHRKAHEREASLQAALAAREVKP